MTNNICRCGFEKCFDKPACCVMCKLNKPHGPRCLKNPYDRREWLGKMTTLYCFWTGENQMTENRYNNFRTLQNSGLNVLLITRNNLNLYVSENYPLHQAFQYLSAVHQADYLRCYFMHVYGGAYCDIKNLNKSWIESVKLLESSPNKMGIGYKEVPHGSAESPEWSKQINEYFSKNYFKLIGCGCFIFKPNTSFTRQWFSDVNTKLSAKYPLLLKYPANSPRSAADHDNYPYPLRWFEILGEIFHPCCMKYQKYLLNSLPPASFENYM